MADGEWEEDELLPAEFEYVRPSTLPEALQLLAERGDEGKLLASGIDAW